jgi:hypothetical protein
MHIRLSFATLFLLLLLNPTQAQTWNQVGETIFGEEEYDLGHSVSLSSDGTIMAVDCGSNYHPGRIYAYKWDGNGWMQLGDVINSGCGDLKMSGDGSIMVVGLDTDHDTLGRWTGSVKVFRWDGLGWLQKGKTIYGESDGCFFGYSVGINRDGNEIVSYSRFNDNKVWAYQWNDSLAKWEQKGSTVSMVMTSSSITCGAMDYSADGSAFIIGDPYSNNGKAAVYAWDGSDWTQKGEAFNGVAGEQFATNVNINADGSTILISSPLNDEHGNNTGEIKLYHWNGSGWVQKGQTIVGPISYACDCCLANMAASLDDAGNTFAYWCMTSVDTLRGVVKSYSWNGNEWIKKGADIEGGTGDNVLVNYLSLNATGDVFAFGCPYDFIYPDGLSNGRVKVYSSRSNLSSGDPLHTNSALTAYVDQPNNRIVFSQDVKLVTVYTLNGQVLINGEVNGSQMDISMLAPGTYILKIWTEKGFFTEKFIKE